MPVDHEMDLVVEVVSEPVQEAAHHLGGKALGEYHEVHPSLGAIADIAFTENRRLLLRRTMGFRPFSPQVRPVTWSERMPIWSANRISPPSLFAFARICGHVSSRSFS
ncbi:hypothetical protein ABZ690_03225 [Streptomyces sp. NPDC006967]|uniref:hypothetical protein n=1 Tax=Streptomyces sp. NPDC006967 TaxID=3156906 RepID=UPI0033DCD3C7